MSSFYTGHRKLVRAVASLVVCLFFITNITWAYPDFKISPQNNTIQVQSIFSPIISSAGEELRGQVDFEIRTIIGMAKKGSRFQDINSALDIAFVSDKTGGRKRVLKVRSNPESLESNEGVAIDVELVSGTGEGKRFRILSAGKGLDSTTVVEIDDGLAVEIAKEEDTAAEKDDLASLVIDTMEEALDTEDLSGARILEVGFGQWTRHWKDLAARGMDITGIDIDPKAAKSARKGSEKAELITGDVVKAPELKRRKFEAVLMRQVLASTTDGAERRRILKRVHSLLGRNGRLILNDVDLDLFTLHKDEKLRASVEEHYATINIEWLVKDTGFAIEKVDRERNILVARKTFELPQKMKTSVEEKLLPLRDDASAIRGLAEFILDKKSDHAFTMFLMSKMQNANRRAGRAAADRDRQKRKKEEAYADRIRDVILEINSVKGAPGRYVIPRLFHSKNKRDIKAAKYILKELGDKALFPLLTSGTRDGDREVRENCSDLLVEMIREDRSVVTLIEDYERFTQTNSLDIADFIVRAVALSGHVGRGHIMAARRYEHLKKSINSMMKKAKKIKPEHPEDVGKKPVFGKHAGDREQDAEGPLKGPFKAGDITCYIEEVKRTEVNSTLKEWFDSAKKRFFDDHRRWKSDLDRNLTGRLIRLETENGEILGLMTIHRGDFLFQGDMFDDSRILPVYLIDHLEVSEGMRGKGLGKVLIAKAAQISLADESLPERTRGTLVTRPAEDVENAPKGRQAKDFYYKNGFQYVEVPLDRIEEDEYFYLSLSPAGSKQLVEEVRQMVPRKRNPPRNTGS